MEDAERVKRAQEAILQDQGLATRVATEVARALNLPVRVIRVWKCWVYMYAEPLGLIGDGGMQCSESNWRSTDPPPDS